MLSTGATGVSDQWFAALEEFVLARMGETHLPSVTVAAVERGETIYARGFGMRDIERSLPATPRTRYGIGSVTKSFTCVALLQLQEQGRLRLDDPVDRYLPLAVRPFGEAIQLHHFMTHSSGIPALAYAEAIIRHGSGASDHYLAMGGYDDMLTFLNGAGDWVSTRPGERWFYLNEGYVLLGAVIERVSGESYNDYVHAHILRPLGMARTSFIAADGVDDETAVPYVITKDKEQRPSRYLNGRLTSDGGLISTVDDMTAYLKMFLARGRANGAAILSPSSTQAMLGRYVALPQEIYPGGEAMPIGHYGYGLSTYPDFFGHTLAGHGGAVLVSTAHLAFVPDRDIGVVVLANGTGYALQHIAYFALASMLGEDPWQIPGLRVERALQQLEGRYETYQGTYGATVTRAGDFLMLKIENKLLSQTVPLVPLNLDPARPRFFTLTLGRRLLVDFHVRPEGIEVIYERYRMRRVGNI
jgi:CubicO group peptidase (beta-lactamase class C family)